MTVDELETLIRNSEPEALLPILDGIEPGQRTKLVQSVHKLLKALYAELQDHTVVEGQPKEDWVTRGTRYVRRQMCCHLAIHRMGNWTDIQKLRKADSLNGENFGRLFDMLFPFLERERPDWIEKFAGAILDESGYVDWTWIQRLMKAGLCGRPATDNYLIKMPTDVVFLRANPDLLEHEVFDLFRLLPRTHKQLFWEDVTPDPGDENDAERGYRGFPFCWSLGRLAKEGLISRERLLAASLEALQLGRHPSDAKWFYEFHEFLEPTIEERASLQTVYCDLLTTDVPTVVAFALEATDKLAKAGRLDPANFFACADRVFSLKNKGTATTVLKQIEQLAKGDPSLKVAAALAATAGLAHETPDVQKATLKTLEGLKLDPDERVLGAIQSRMESVVASLKDRARTLLEKMSGSPRVAGGTSEPESVATRDAAADTVVPPVAASRIADENRITPIASLDELITTVSGAIEKWNRGSELERIMDGLSCLCGERPADFAARVRPLSKRISKLFEDWKHINAIEMDFVGRLMVTIQIWLKDSEAPSAVSANQDVAEAAPPPPLYHEEPTADALEKSRRDAAVLRTFDALDKRLNGRLALTFLDGRLTELESWIATGPGRPLLSAPSHRGGWISAAAFVERLKWFEHAGLDPQSYDLRQALLRLAPEGRDEVLQSATGLTDSRQKAIQWALDTIKPTTVAEAAVYIAAKAGRDPEAPLLVSESPVVLERLTYSWYATRALYSSDLQERWALTLKISPDPFQSPLFRFPPLTLWPIAHHAAHVYFRDGKATRLAEMWPGNLTPFFAAGAVAILSSLETTNNEVKALPEFLPPLFESHVEFSEMAQLMLALALVAKSADLRGLAVDGLISVMNDGRCRGPELGTIYRRLLPSSLIRINRLADPLKTAARSSPRHMLACALTVQSMFSDLDALPDDAHHLLTPLLDWVVELKRPLEESFQQSLSKISGSGKSAKLAKSLLKHHVAVQ